jgi:acyl carrier protein
MIQSPPNREQGLEIIRNIVAECLARNLADVRPESRLITELGADSLDFVDLIFTLEKRFGVRIRENDLISRASTFNQDGTAVEFLPPEAVSRLLPWLPELATAPDPSRIRPAQVLPLVTVEGLWLLVEQKMASS